MSLLLLAWLNPAGAPTSMTAVPTATGWNDVVLEFGESSPLKITGDTVIVPANVFMLVTGTIVLLSPGSNS